MSGKSGRLRKSPSRGDALEVEAPPCWSSEIRLDGNRARQMLCPPGRARPDKSASPARKRRVGDLSPSAPARVTESWIDSFNFTLGDRNTGRPGLRLPQLGAVHAVLGYWTTGSTQPATVVMPTGTGKTETMIALLATGRPERLLVLVPSDVLRTQLAEKFEALGVLQESGVIGPQALRPVVGRLRHAFSTPETARRFAESCNVIVATPPALFASEPEVTKALLDTCSHLFVDEAHHVEAATWRRIRAAFEAKPVLQFTATPFREDGRRMAGRIVYAFPLRQAQKHGYFSRINYLSVLDFHDPDRAIATAAVGRLREDLAAGRDHVLMARVHRIGLAQETRNLYAELAPDLAPVVLHSSLPAGARRSSLAAIQSRQSRVIVCVDMLGEGFDLPSLKVAAIHHQPKSLGVTLQFIGRFARVAGASIGEASVVTGRAEGRYDENLRKLYSEEPDWNLIIRDLSEAAVGEEREVSEFEAAFGALPEEVSPRNIEPKMSTVIYRTQCQAWRPEAVRDLYSDDDFFTDCVAVNGQSHVAWFVLVSRSPVRWGELETVADVGYDLYLLYWNEARQLLYINSSNTGSVYEDLAKAVCGDEVQLFTGEAVYRAMAHVERLVPTNVGLLDTRNRSRRFSMHVGADVVEGFPVAEAQTKAKTNIFAHGYENGIRVSIGGSLKGRIWSYRVAPTIKHWVNWCDHVGGKVSDPGIDVDEIMRGFIRPMVVETRPPYVALGVEWPWEIFLNVTDETRIEMADASSDAPSSAPAGGPAGGDWPLVDADLVVTEFSESGPIRFNVATPGWTAGYEIDFADGRLRYRAVAAEAEVVSRRSRIRLSDYLTRHGLTILFEQDAMVVPPGVLLKPDRDLPAFEADRLIVLDWSGVDLRKESQGASREADSIQARAIEYVRSLAQWEIVIDDHGAGEIADIVAMRVEGDRLVVELVHCKRSSEPEPGGRVADLYEVCGQTQKSVRWRRNTEALFRRLIHRQRSRMGWQGKTGFIVGDGNALYRLEERARRLKPDFGMLIAQPGLAKRMASRRQLDLLGSTEVYLCEVASASLRVLCSP